jgi:hypothetical protein
MEPENHGGQAIFGHDILKHDGVPRPEEYAASGTITQDRTFVEASGGLGGFDTDAQHFLLTRARA